MVRRNQLQFRPGVGETSEIAPAGGGVQMVAVGWRQFAHEPVPILFPVWQKASDNAKQAGMTATVKLRCICLPVFLGGFLPATPVEPKSVEPIETLTQLQTRIDAHISQPRFAAAAWGIKVVSLDTGRTLFERDAGKLLKPASNAKLFTGALALDRLGPDYRIKTSLYAKARPDKNVQVRPSAARGAQRRRLRQIAWTRRGRAGRGGR